MKIARAVELAALKMDRLRRVALNRSRFREEAQRKLPSNLIDVVTYSYDGSISPADRELGGRIEKLRADVAREYKDKAVLTFGSPRSEAALFDADGRVIPGEYSRSLKGSFTRTGTKVFPGVQLKKITEAMGARRILELGTNTGLSGCYFLSALNRPFLYTVEGSPDLCSIAEKNLRTSGGQFTVKNGLFDDVLTELAVEKWVFDLCFVDGQHEEKATLHYAERLKSLTKPGGVLVFDDIYWSEGMNSAWRTIAGDVAYSMTMDLRNRGVCILADPDNPGPKVHFDLTTYVGVPAFQRKGW